MSSILYLISVRGSTLLNQPGHTFKASKSIDRLFWSSLISVFWSYEIVDHIDERHLLNIPMQIDILLISFNIVDDWSHKY